LAQVHPALAPLRAVGTGYELDVAAAPNWFGLSARRGLAGYGLARALRMLLDLLAGLTALHDTHTDSGAGFVHGELAPSFARVDAQGITRLVALAPWHWQNLEVPLAPESLGHLAPERLLGDAIDRRADVFSAGVLLWEALAGRRLFEHDSVDQIVTRLMGGKLVLPELPPELAWAIPLKAVALRALSVDPDQRFADCPELAAAIEAVARRRVASHAEVLGYFRAPARQASSIPPRLPRGPSLEEEFRSSHKSSLSALVAPTSSVTPAAELDIGARLPGRRARGAAWIVTALLALSAALGAALFTRQNRTYSAAHEAPPSAPELRPATATPAPTASALAPEASAPSVSVAVVSDSAAAIGEPRLAPDRVHAPHAVAAPHDNHGRAAQVARPLTPAKAPRVRDKSAEQYGI
jgi:eukaryotic-like serine/threonine-protein kinase